MSGRLEQMFGRRTVLCDGAMGTSLHVRGISIDRCCDELNLSNPEMVRSIQEEYLQAGAEIIETNTFGASAFRLERYGLRDRVQAINEAGVRIARQAIAQAAEKQTGIAYVAGSVGPLGVQLESRGKTGLDEAQAVYREQIRALAAGGPGVGADLLIIETMMSLAQAEQAVLAAHAAAPDLPVMVMMTVDEQRNCLDGSLPEVAAARITSWGADAVGVNCSVGPAMVLSALECMAAATNLPLVAMPNAGMPRRVDGHNVYLCSPEYMARFARQFTKAGAQFIGGCCGTTSEHIRAMKSALRAPEGSGAERIRMEQLSHPARAQA